MKWSYMVRIFGVLGVKSPLVCQFWTACLLMFRALLRISHIVPLAHTLRWSDLKFKDWGVLVCIRSAKSLPDEGLSIPLARVSDIRFCVCHWLKKLYVKRDNCTVFPLLDFPCFRGLLKLYVLKSHIHKHLTSHSFRRGGATFLSNLGVPLSYIKDRGGWKSNCVYRYCPPRWR